MQRRLLHISLVGYAALLVGPVPVAVLTLPAWPLFVAGCLLGAAFGGLASCRITLPDGVLTRPRIVAGFVPVVWLAPAVTTANSVLDLYVSPWFLGSVGAVVWLFVLLFAYAIHQRERLDGLTELASFEAGPPWRVQRQIQLAVGVLLLLTGLAVVVVTLFGSEQGNSFSSLVWLPSMIPTWLFIFRNRSSHHVAVTGAGLRIDQQLHDWDTFDGYELTDDALDFSRTKWYHSGPAFDRDDIDDLPAVVDALEQSLDRD